MRPRVPSLSLELAFVLLFALAASNAATYLILRGTQQEALREAQLTGALERAAAVSSLMHALDPKLHPAMAVAASSRGEIYVPSTEPNVPIATTDPMAMGIQERLQQRLAPLGIDRVHASIGSAEALRPTGSSTTDRAVSTALADAQALRLSIRLAPRTWLNSVMLLPVPASPLRPLLLAAGLAVLATMVASFWMGRRISGPLRGLTAAARNMRPGEAAPAAPEQGPEAVREATRAFNAMSQRLQGVLTSQRELLAALGHDLRTPITALRIRAELVEDEALRQRMNDSLDELQSTTEAALAAVRAGTPGEESRVVDLAALADALVSDLADIGGKVEFIPAPPAPCRCRPTALRRALRNLIENALRYGDGATVSLERGQGRLRMHVDDRGPGIPPAELEKVFQPFQRGETSRSRETGGHGLGLTIARAVAQAHGGEVVLRNREGGGLRASLLLPAS